MGTRSTIQRREKGQADHRSADIHAVAEHGVAGAGGTLPYAAAIQHSFGHHDIAGIAAHTGGAAREANAAMGSLGYASGNRIAFGTAPSLHTAAHEAAHVVQQRAGVQLKGGVGEAGDRYERHADSVAELVVQGKSAESLLDTMAGGSGSRAIQQRRAGPHTVQHRGHAVQFNGQSAGYSTVDGTDVANTTVQFKSVVQHNALGELWEGVTSLPTVVRNNRLRDQDERQYAEAEAIRSLNESLGPIKTTLDAMAEANEAGGPRINQLSSNITQIRRALAALDAAEGAIDAARIATRWSTAQAAWDGHRANPTPESAQRAARAAGDIIAPLGRLLGRFPPPIGSLAGLLENANGDFFSGVVGNIHHSDRRLRGIYREAGLDEHGNERVERGVR